MLRLRARQTNPALTPQVHRVLERFAVAALAGELATKVGLTSWPQGAANAAAREMFMQWFEAQEGTTNQEIATAVQRTKDYISKHPDRFQTIGTTDHDPKDGWRDQDWIYIRTDSWLVMHRENDPVEMARLHADGGLLRSQKGSGYQVRMGRNITGRPRAYAVHASKLLGTAQA